MRMDLKLALRNVFRNRRRTAFSLAVIVVGVSILLFVLGFIGEGLLSTQRSLACETGAVQIADRRLFENTAQGYEDLISPATLDAVVAIVSDEAGVIGATWQLDFAGLIGDETGSTLILGRGIIPCNCVEDYECIVTEGTPLAEDESRQVILGRALARRLGVAPGDRINIATGTVSGNFNAATVDVVGELTYSLEAVERQLGLFPIAFVQKLLKTDGVERVLIGVEDLGRSQDVAADLQARLDSEGIPLVTRTWEDLNPSYDSIRSFYAAFSGLAGVAVFVLVFFSVLEVLTMAFLERTRETGTLRAFGTSRARVFRTFLMEGAWLGLIGGVAGVACGVILSIAFNAIGFSWSPPGAAIPQAIRLQIDLAVVGVPLLTALLATLVAAIYPAWKNTRSGIVDALRSV
jgi:putative ABC transport system permease protein